MSVSKQCQKHNQNGLYSALSDIWKVLVNIIGTILKKTKKKRNTAMSIESYSLKSVSSEQPKWSSTGWTADHVLCATE